MYTWQEELISQSVYGFERVYFWVTYNSGKSELVDIWTDGHDMSPVGKWVKSLQNVTGIRKAWVEKA